MGADESDTQGEIAEVYPWGRRSAAAWLPAGTLELANGEAVAVNAAERAIVDSVEFQRLRDVSPPSGHADDTGNAFEHSLSTLVRADWLFERLIADAPKSVPTDSGIDALFGPDPTGRLLLAQTKTTVRLAALMHDIGHLPFSHVLEDDLGLLDASRKPVPELEVLLRDVSGDLSPEVDKALAVAVRAGLAASVSGALQLEPHIARGGQGWALLIADIVRQAADGRLVELLKASGGALSARAERPCLVFHPMHERAVAPTRRDASRDLALTWKPEGRLRSEPPRGFAIEDAVHASLLGSWLLAAAQRQGSAPLAPRDRSHQCRALATRMRPWLEQQGEMSVLQHVHDWAGDTGGEATDPALQARLRFVEQLAKAVVDGERYEQIFMQRLDRYETSPLPGVELYARCREFADRAAARAGIERYHVVVHMHRTPPSPPLADLLVDCDDKLLRFDSYARDVLGWPITSKRRWYAVVAVHHSVRRDARDHITALLRDRLASRKRQLDSSPGKPERRKQPTDDSAEDRRRSLRIRFLERSRTMHGLDRDVLRDVHEHGWIPTTDG
jgi:hypothetical protein